VGCPGLDGALFPIYCWEGKIAVGVLVSKNRRVSGVSTVRIPSSTSTKVTKSCKGHKGLFHGTVVTFFLTNHLGFAQKGRTQNGIRFGARVAEIRE
jgi:hypothetical protein